MGVRVLAEELWLTRHWPELFGAFAQEGARVLPGMQMHSMIAENATHNRSALRGLNLSLNLSMAG